MTDELKNSKYSGTFKVYSEEEIFGELSIQDSETSLYVRKAQSFDEENEIPDYIKGTLYDFTKVTLVDCMRKASLKRFVEGQPYCYTTIFPHFILYGDCYLDKGEKDVRRVWFTIDDISTLFYDFNAFGQMLDTKSLAKELSKTDRPDHKTEIGSNPLVFYFTGQHEIFTLDTNIGKIEVSHGISYSMPNGDGIRVDSEIGVSITFSQSCTFEKAFSDALLLTKYFELLIGRPQSLLNLNLSVKETGESFKRLKVISSLAPNYERTEKRSVHPSEVLVSATLQSRVFGDMLKSWIERHDDWRDARSRFFVSFEEETYTTDRLIRSANMFDILPDSAVPEDAIISEELLFAKNKSRALFKKLPLSPERDSILGALSRLGKSSLKRKVQYRAKLLLDAATERFPELDFVTDEAVNCRNHYVHGSKSKIDYASVVPTPIFFLTDTLDFVFAVSDLIECGWNFNEWCESSTSMVHPFNRYRMSYKDNLNELRKLFP